MKPQGVARHRLLSFRNENNKLMKLLLILQPIGFATYKRGKNALRWHRALLVGGCCTPYDNVSCSQARFVKNWSQLISYDSTLLFAPVCKIKHRRDVSTSWLRPTELSTVLIKIKHKSLSNLLRKTFLRQSVIRKVFSSELIRPTKSIRFQFFGNAKFKVRSNVGS